MKKLLLSALAPLCLVAGLGLVIAAPFFSLAAGDLVGSPWPSAPILMGTGFILTVCGICFWILAWKLWFPK